MAEAERSTSPVRSRRRARSSCASISAKDVPETDVRSALATGDMGFLHSFTTGSTVDGPGVRVVAWTTGCMWRCRYCHNPDTWTMSNGIPVSVAKATEELRKYRHGLKVMCGGLTISGGEPLMQHRFVVKLFAAAKEMGIHTALETNGFLGERLSDDELAADRSRDARHQGLGPGAPPGAHGPGHRSRRSTSRAGSRAQAQDLGALRARAGSDRRPRRHRADRRVRGRARQRRARRRAAVPPDGPVQVGASSASAITSRTRSRRRPTSSSKPARCSARRDSRRTRWADTVSKPRSD